MVTVLPYMDQVGMDFLNTDCMLENPFLGNVEKCTCFRTKYPKEVVLSDSTIPLDAIEHEGLDVHVLRNASQFPSDLSIMEFVQFPSLNGGNYPLSCYEIHGENTAIYRYDQFYQKDKMTRLLKGKGSWNFSWLVIKWMCKWGVF